MAKNEKYLVITLRKLKSDDAVYCNAAISGRRRTEATPPAKREYPIKQKIDFM